MPEVSRFYGIVIKMFFKPKEHEPAHIHALYEEYMATKMSPKCTMNDPGYNFLATRARLFQETEEGGLPCGKERERDVMVNNTA